MTLPDAFQSQAQYIQVSPKFQQQPDSTIQPVAFPGYTVITPPCKDDRRNAAFYEHLQTYQQQIMERLEPGMLIPLPSESFHFTLADLIWANSFRAACEDPLFETQLQLRLAQAFHKSEGSVQAEEPIHWQVIGLFLRTRALGVCLVPKDEQSFERVMALRRTIYQSPELIALGVEQQYNFTAHITLGYFGEAAATADLDRFSRTLVELNDLWLESSLSQDIWVYRAELRKFDDMLDYYRDPDWAVLEF